MTEIPQTILERLETDNRLGKLLDGFRSQSPQEGLSASEVESLIVMADTRLRFLLGQTRLGAAGVQKAKNKNDDFN